MKELVIIGAGGYGRNVYWQCNSDIDNGRAWTIKGFLDNRSDVLDGFGIPIPILGSPFTHKSGPNEIFLCALGEPTMRRKYAAPLVAQGADFINLCTDVGYPPSVKAGRGIIFEPNVQLGSDTTIGDFVTILSMAVIGHDVILGDYVQVASFAFIGGGARVGNDVQIHPHSCVLPGVNIGDRSVIGAGSVVVRDVPADCTVFGNPAKIVFAH